MSPLSTRRGTDEQGGVDEGGATPRAVRAGPRTQLPCGRHQMPPTRSLPAHFRPLPARARASTSTEVGHRRHRRQMARRITNTNLFVSGRPVGGRRPVDAPVQRTNAKVISVIASAAGQPKNSGDFPELSG